MGNNGHEKVRSRGPVRIKAFLCDVYGTLIRLDGMTSDDLAVAMAAEVLGKNLHIDPRKFGESVYRLRLEMARNKRLPLSQQSGPEGWARINVLALGQFGVECTKAQGKRISTRYTETLDTMRAGKGVHKFLHDVLKRGLGERHIGSRWRAYAATNSSLARVRWMLSTRVLLGYFRGIICPETLGGIRKPDPKFFLRACEAAECEPHEALVLGNSRINDLSAAAAGLWTILLEGHEKTDGRAAQEAEDLFGPGIWSRVLPCANLDDAKDTIMRFFANP
jgi:FMN phosphatase YigB (HAD superfamily)